MSLLDAVILAGEKEGAIPVMGKSKALLPFQGRPLIGWVMQALDRAESVASITLAGPCRTLESGLAGIETQKPLRFVEQGDNIFENIWKGSLSTFADYRPGQGSEGLKDSGQAGKAVVVLTCDTPLVSPLEIDHFINTAPLDRADFVYGVTRRELLLPFEPRGDDPGITFIYFCIRELIFRHSNIFCLRPLKLAEVMETYIPVVYRLRYQRHFRNVVAASRETIRYTFTPGSLRMFVLLQAAKNFHKRGWYGLRDALRDRLSREWVEQHLSKVLRTRFAIHETIGPGPALDIDDEQSYNAFLAMAEVWKQVQLKQIQAALADEQ